MYPSSKGHSLHEKKSDVNYWCEIGSPVKIFANCVEMYENPVKKIVLNMITRFPFWKLQRKPFATV